MKRLILILSLFLPKSSIATDEPWELVWVARSQSWFIKQGRGELQQNGNKLNGKLTGKDGVSEYIVSVEIKGETATATFEVVPSDAGKSTLHGTYLKTERSGPNNCWETIHLQNNHEYIGLLRNITCKP